MREIDAIFFDGRTTKGEPVLLVIEDGDVRVTGPGINRSAPLLAVGFSEPLGSTPRIVTFPDASFCEVADYAGLARVLAAHGVGPSRVSQWETSPRWIVGGLLVTLAVLVLGYHYGLPRAARALAERTPSAVLDSLDRQVLDLLDRTWFEPSQVPPERRASLSTAFQRLKTPAARSRRIELMFRGSDQLGPNAVALPGGTLVVTDALVALAKDDREIFGVLAHELGHTERRHTVRMLLEQSLLGLVVVWFVGDTSTVLAAAPTALLTAKYSRDHEREADAYAVEMLGLNGVPTMFLADLLERIDRAQSAQNGGRSPALGYLASHPATSERLAVFRGAR